MSAEIGRDTGTGYPACLWCSAIGQDSHRFLTDDEAAEQPQRQLILGGVIIPGERALAGNSDADVLLHALTNAISGISGTNILGPVADRLCLDQGVTNSAVYLHEAQLSLGAWRLGHISFSVEGKKPRLAGWIQQIREQVARFTGLLPEDIGMTATSGEGLTSFGCGEGLQVFCIVTAWRPRHIL